MVDKKTIGEINDNDWIRQALFVPRRVAEATRTRNRTYSSAGEKFFDTTPGGNLSINPKPQFTRTADPKVKSLSPRSKGMGRYYSDAIDDNAFRISIQCGVPEFNSLAAFTGNFFNPAMASLVNRGENNGLSYKAGYVTGFLFTLPLQAFFGVNYLITRISSFVTNTPYSKFYYMKPTMPLYWNSVSTMFNQLSVNMGITQGATKDSGVKQPITPSDIELLQRALPDILKTGTDGELSGIDVYAISTRAQRLANAHHKRLDEIAKNTDNTDDYVAQVKAELKRSKGRKDDLRLTYPTYDKYIDAFLNGPVLTPKPVPSEGEELSEDTQYVRVNEPKLSDHLLAELRDGSQFVSFVVDKTTPTESFSNSTKTSSLAEKLNGANNSARDLRFSFAEGNVLGDVQKSIGSMIGDFATGALDSVGLSGLAAVAGSAYVDIPKTYDSSSADVGKASFKTRLSSPYGNKLSILLDIYLPLCCILAAGLPRSTGKASYSSPFLCRLFSQGMFDVKLGMIDSITISRAVGGIGLTADHLPNAIDVDISFVNMDEIVHMPIMESFGLDTLFSAFDEDTAFTDYLSVLSGLSLYDQYYIAPRAKLAWAKTVQQYRAWSSTSSFASYAAGTVPGQLISAISRAGDVI